MEQNDEPNIASNIPTRKRHTQMPSLPVDESDEAYEGGRRPYLAPPEEISDREDQARRQKRTA